MTDLEMRTLCAHAMGYFDDLADGPDYMWRMANKLTSYDPFKDDAQAMALVKKFRLSIEGPSEKTAWFVISDDGEHVIQDADLNRAICECVAKMQEAKSKP